MKKTFELGKIDIEKEGRKTNLATINMSFENGNLSISGNVWNTLKSDIIVGGQCLDELKPFFENDLLFNSLYYLWKNYHLNDMHAGTPEQENAIKLWENEGNKYDYALVCEHLKKINLYEVMNEGKLYKYGYGWLKQEIPEDDAVLINELLNK